MISLLEIRYTVQQVADAITAALGVDAEIVDNELNIVAGTGHYKAKVGLKEEGGRLDSGFMYSRVLKTGKAFTVRDAISDPYYGPLLQKGSEYELAEVCSPILYENRILGVIGLVAFTEDQRGNLLKNDKDLHYFLSRMSYLLASKASEADKAHQLNGILETIHEGIISIDVNAMVMLCNLKAARLLHRSREAIVNASIASVLPKFVVPQFEGIENELIEREEIFNDPQYGPIHLIITIKPILGGEVITKAGKSCSPVTGVVISLRDIADVRKLAYDFSESKQTSSFDMILGNSEIMSTLKEKAKRVAVGTSTVLVTGESGTGKELFARAIHFESPRGQGPFVSVNCGAIPETLLESELFGYEGGAFTGAKKGGKPGKFELANGGTIFLDEIGDMPLHLQVKLLHVLQRREIERVGGNVVISVDVRVIAATNKNLENMMKEGEFREDLYFRLSVIPLYIPPLRARKDDVPLLVQRSLIKMCKILGKEDGAKFDEDSYSMVLSYDWPGNVRELENTIEYAVNMTTGSLITRECLPSRLRKSVINTNTALTLRDKLDDYEREILKKYLEQYGKSLEDKRKIAGMLGVSQATLYRRIRELGLGV